MKQALTFRVHTSNLLKEIVECAIPTSAGVLYVPVNQFRLLLCAVAERATKLNDPELNKLMCQLTLYEESDPNSKHYNPDLMQEMKINEH
ncbi:MAG TPA: hypothetical protein ENH82_15100 [bacterium]|nr:hypothetical protein [bacterium]